METRNDPNARVPVLFPVPFPVDRSVGTLCIVGGGGTPQIVIDEFFRIAGNGQARVLHIPSATITFPEIENLREYYSEFYGKNPESFEFLHTYERSVAETEDFSRPLGNATGVWMGGGCQIRLADLFRETPVHRGIEGVLQRGGIISGTSSGAAIMSDVMIKRGYEEVQYGHGFALYPKAIVDPHFSGRERQKRVGRAVIRFPDQIGVGVDEKSALVINGNRAGVIGMEERSAWYHFRGDEGKTVRRYRLKAGEWIDLGVPVRGADPALLEEKLRAVREPEVLTAEALFEPDPD